MATLTEASKSTLGELGEAAKKIGRSLTDAFRGEEGRANAAVSRIEKDAAAATLRAEGAAKAAQATAEANARVAAARSAAGLAPQAAKKSGVFVTGATKIVKAGWHVANRPVTWGIQIAGSGASKLGNAFAHNPRTAWIVTGVGAVLGAGAWVNGRAHKRSEAMMTNLNAQLEAQQQMMAASPYMQQGQFTNSVDPTAFAAMESRMKSSQQPSFGATVDAQRAPVGPAV